MVLFNHAARQMAAKIVYYGPGLCGKTTNLATVYQKTSAKARGEMVSLNTDTDRTLFFDLLPMDMGEVWGFRTKLQLYTVPGQVFYDATRKLVLKGADGVVFVADSQAQMLEANRESLRNLEANLRELGLEPGQVPLVFQWNKRDLSHLTPLEDLERELNPEGRPSFCSVASEGTGVFETLKGITRLTLVHLKERHFTPKGMPVEVEPQLDPLPVPRTAPEPAGPALRGRLSAPTVMKPKISVAVPRPAAPIVAAPPKVPLPRVQRPLPVIRATAPSPKPPVIRTLKLALVCDPEATAV